MKSLTTRYMGLELKNPIILGSTPLASDIDGLKRAEDSGLGAIVLNSIYEEQILNNTDNDMKGAEDYLTHTDAGLFLQSASRDYYIDQYLELIQKAKASLEIPIIASINSTSQSSWLDYAKRFSSSGADAVEINHFIVAGDAKVDGKAIEKQYISLAQKARKEIKIPLSMKIGWHFTSISNMVKKLSDIGIDAIVLFNHFFRPDIDIEKIAVDTDMLQPKGDYADTLRWTAMMSAEIEADICSSTGIRDSSTVIKMLLAGAKAVQISSVIEMNGFNVVNDIINGVEQWMDRHGFEGIEDFRGRLAQEKIGDPQSWERSATMKLNSSFRGI